MTVLIPLVAALLGALAAGLFRVFEARAERTRRRSAILKALGSEVSMICQIVEAEGYRKGLADLIVASSELGGIRTMVADIRSDHFTVFNSLAASLGELEAAQAAEIVRFYSMCKYALDILRPENPIHGSDDDERLASLRGLAALVEAILASGEKIAAFAGVTRETLKLIEEPKAA